MRRTCFYCGMIETAETTIKVVGMRNVNRAVSGEITRAVLYLLISICHPAGDVVVVSLLEEDPSNADVVIDEAIEDVDEDEEKGTVEIVTQTVALPSACNSL